MTAYRFRVKLDADLTALWRDIVVRGDRTIAEFQSVLNRAVGFSAPLTKHARKYWFDRLVRPEASSRENSGNLGCQAGGPYWGQPHYSTPSFPKHPELCQPRICRRRYRHRFVGDATDPIWTPRPIA